MNIQSIILLAVVLGLACCAFRYAFRKRKDGGCGGCGCSSCEGCAFREVEK